MYVYIIYDIDMYIYIYYIYGGGRERVVLAKIILLKTGTRGKGSV